MLQLRRSASAIVTVSPGPQAPPLALKTTLLDCGSWYEAGLGSVDWGV